ncbi:MAG: carboxypeptidase regulatory-like domain-containing protein [Euryarchaeota archaeon]|nr:carboxypeptidase regulatory-like domain-containing protein [Euryarchaeota archaeon]
MAASLVLIAMLAGCTSADDVEIQEADTPGSTIAVVFDGNQTVGVPVTNETGSILGQVRNDAGDPLPDVHVAVLQTSHVGLTNRTGWFQFVDLTPGKYVLRVDKQNYQAVEAEVAVEAAAVSRAIVTLVPVVSANYVAHTHDYWAGRSEVGVADRSYEFKHKNRAQSPGSPTATAMDAYETGYGAVFVGKCWSPNYGSASEFYLDDPAQTVWAGTRFINVTFTWSATDAVGVSGLAVGWRHANELGPAATSYNLSRLLKSGETFSIPVDASMWDSGHQSFTSWRFWACLMGKEESPVVLSYSPGRAFLGKYHVKASIARGWPLYVEPPHTDFWQGRTTVPVLDTYSNMTCTGTSCTYYYQNPSAPGNKRAEFYYFTFVPPKGRLVPPGTETVRITLAWSTTSPGPAMVKPLSVSYAPANVPPAHQDDITKFKTAPPSERGAASRTYLVKLEPGEPDMFYQRASNWKFVWGNEGEEKDPYYQPGCACVDLSVHMVVEALRSPPSADDASSFLLAGVERLPLAAPAAPPAQAGELGAQRAAAPAAKEPQSAPPLAAALPAPGFEGATWASAGAASTAALLLGAWWVLRRRPAPVPRWLQEADAALRRADYPEAARWAERVLAREPAHLDATVIAAVAMLRTGRGEDLARFLRRQVTRTRDRTGIVRLLSAIAASKRGNYAGAEEDLRRALDMNPLLALELSAPAETPRGAKLASPARTAPDVDPSYA